MPVKSQEKVEGGRSERQSRLKIDDIKGTSQPRKVFFVSNRML